MTYKQTDDQVTLEMTRDEYLRILHIMAYAAGAVLRNGEAAQFRRWIQFANELNQTNPNFRQYEISEADADPS